MHIPVGLIIVIVVGWFFYHWRTERKRMAGHYRHHEMLYPNSDKAALRQYVKDVYGRR